MKIKNRRALKLYETKPIDEAKGWTICLKHNEGNDKMWSIYDDIGDIVLCFTERGERGGDMSICYRGKKALELVDEIIGEAVGASVTLTKLKERTK